MVELGEEMHLIGLLGEVKNVEHNLGVAMYGHMAGWRCGQDDLSLDPIYWRVDSRDVVFIDDDFRAWTPVSLKVRHRDADGHVSLVVTAIVESPFSDRELEQLMSTLRAPVIHQSLVLGDLVFDRATGDVFEGTGDWLGSTVRFEMQVENEKPDGTALKTVEALWADQAGWDRAIREAAADAFLEWKNTDGLFDDEAPLTSEEFMKRLTLTDVISDHTNSSDGFSIWLSDGGIFGGHSLIAAGTLSQGISSVEQV